MALYRKLVSVVALLGITGLSASQMTTADEARRGLAAGASATALDEAIDKVRVDPRTIEPANRPSKAIRNRPVQDAQPEPGAASSGDGLAKQLQNPVAALISVPFQSNFEFGGGPDGDGFRYLLNFQPVIPISISKDWNVISRTVVPFISQKDMIGTSSQSGLGDITQSFFFSPKQPTKRGGIVWGAGPVFLLPSATDDLLGQEKLGIGPTAVVLKQADGWTFGLLANHIWSVEGSDDRDDVDSTFLQPFISYTTKASTTFGVQTESTYDWEHDQWTVPLIASVSQLVKIGKQPISLQLGGKYWAEGPDGTPDWGIRFAVILLFPK